jgi:hypothetical protein
MNEATQGLVSAVLIGVGATAFLDVTAILRNKLVGTPMPDYGLVGRWFAWMPRGRFRHDAIAASAPMPGERIIGWAAHYLIGIAFAGLLIAVWGLDWVRNPTPGPALILGIGSVAAPFLLMQPGMGAGLAGRRTPRPMATRLRSVVTHTMFGLGLYFAGWFVLLSGL